MYKPHFLFEDTPDSTIIWKYLSFDKFLSLLITQSLYFCRSDKFEDPYEGTISSQTLEQIKTFTDQLDYNNKEEIFEQMLSLLNASRKMTLVNCWHINEFESDGMWKLYSNVKNSIAIQTTVGKLKEAIEKTNEDVYIGKVNYVDFDVDFVQAFNMLGPFIYKRKSFAHEQELRAVIWAPGLNLSNTVEQNMEEELTIPIVQHGKSINIDINLLIERIHISPLSESWFEKIVKSIIAQYQFDFQIVSSVLLNIPEYLAIQHSTGDIENTVKVPVEVLKAFIEKDSFRIQREEDDRLRTIELQTNSIQEKLRFIGDKIETIYFKSGLKSWNGAEAIAKIGQRFEKLKKLDYNLLIDPSSNLFMLIANFDSIMIEIESSIIPTREKTILVKNTLFLFTEKCMTGLSIIAVKIMNSQNEIDEEYREPLNAFTTTIFKFLVEIDRREV